MASTTFSGPIKAGTIKEGSSANVGSVVMAQSAVIDIIGATNESVMARLPANSQIVDVILNVSTVSNDSGTATVQVGTPADTNAYIPATNVKALGTTRGTLDTEATNVGNGVARSVLARFIGQNGNGTTGAATVTVLYIQNNNLS